MPFEHTNTQELADVLTKIASFISEKRMIITINDLKLFDEEQQAYMTSLINNYYSGNEEAGEKLIKILNSKKYDA